MLEFDECSTGWLKECVMVLCSPGPRNDVTVCLSLKILYFNLFWTAVYPRYK